MSEEPKFKVGDRVIVQKPGHSGHGEIRTINSINNYAYHMTTDNGYSRNGDIEFGNQFYQFVDSGEIETRVNKKGSSFNLLVKNLDETQLKEVEEFVKGLGE